MIGRVLLGVAVVAAIALTAAGCERKAASQDAKGVTAAAAVPSPPASQQAVPAVESEASLANAAADIGGALAEQAGADIGSIAIAAEADANGGNPTEVDLVLAFDPAAAEEIGRMPAAEWFGRRASYSGTGRVQVMSFLVQPGTGVPETPVDAQGAARAAFVFARYASPGDHRLTVEGEGALSIALGASDFTAEITQ